MWAGIGAKPPEASVLFSAERFTSMLPSNAKPFDRDREKLPVAQSHDVSRESVHAPQHK
jgi:hypothetical protein